MDTQLVYDPYLSTLGICVNCLLDLVICLDCQAGFNSKSVSEHLIHVHVHKHAQLDHKKLQSVLKALGVHESFELQDLPPNCPPIEGLAPFSDAYLCHLCPHIHSNHPSMQTHHQSIHSDKPILQLWNKVAAQQLHPTHNSPFFQVFPIHVAVQKDSHLLFYQSVHHNCQCSLGQINTRLVDPQMVSVWLHSTQWHTLIEGQDVKNLIALVALPTKHEHELSCLSEAVHAYAIQADCVIDMLSQIALRVINSPVPK